MKNLFLSFLLIAAPQISFATNTASLTVETEAAGDKYYRHNFGSVFVNSYNTVVLNLTAKGPDATEIKRIAISGMHFDASSNCPRVLEPGKKCQTKVVFWPSTEGHFFGNLDFYLNDGNIYVDLIGHAR